MLRKLFCKIGLHYCKKWRFVYLEERTIALITVCQICNTMKVARLVVGDMEDVREFFRKKAREDIAEAIKEAE